MEGEVEFQKVDIGQDLFRLLAGDLSAEAGLAGKFHRLAEAEIGFSGSLEIEESGLEVGVVIQGGLGPGLGLVDPG